VRRMVRIEQRHRQLAEQMIDNLHRRFGSLACGRLPINCGSVRRGDGA